MENNKDKVSAKLYEEFLREDGNLENLREWTLVKLGYYSGTNENAAASSTLEGEKPEHKSHYIWKWLRCIFLIPAVGVVVMIYDNWQAIVQSALVCGEWLIGIVFVGGVVYFGAKGSSSTSDDLDSASVDYEIQLLRDGGGGSWERQGYNALNASDAIRHAQNFVTGYQSAGVGKIIAIRVVETRNGRASGTIWSGSG